MGAGVKGSSITAGLLGGRGGRMQKLTGEEVGGESVCVCAGMNQRHHPEQSRGARIDTNNISVSSFMYLLHSSSSLHACRLLAPRFSVASL